MKENEALIVFESDFNALVEDRKRLHELEAKIKLYEQALQEAEAILGRDYAMEYAPFFNLIQLAREVVDHDKRR
jgi:hypothetical protein